MYRSWYLVAFVSEASLHLPMGPSLLSGWSSSPPQNKSRLRGVWTTWGQYRFLRMPNLIVGGTTRFFKIINLCKIIPYIRWWCSTANILSTLWQINNWTVSFTITMTAQHCWCAKYTRCGWEARWLLEVKDVIFKSSTFAQQILLLVFLSLSPSWILQHNAGNE